MSWPNPSETRWAYGSTRAVVEDGLMLPIHRMAKLAGDWPGAIRIGTWRWSAYGETLATIGYRVEIISASVARLSLDFKVNGSPVVQTIWLERRPCRFGGGRWYAQCPVSGRTASKLYLPNGGQSFLSRQAYRLSYQSQRECAIGRSATRRHKLAARLNLGDPEMPIKPRWMHWATFDRAVAQLLYLDRLWSLEMARRFRLHDW
jgi:hypothetical protein